MVHFTLKIYKGRVRWAYHKYTTGATAYKFEYDFFEKDHLGNTRMVLTQQKDTSNYLASMEAAYRTTESQLFSNITTTCYGRASVSGYPDDLTYTNPNDSVSKVDYTGTSGQKMGPSLLLKVMSGDTVKFGVQSYYNSGTGGTNNSSFTDVLNSLANALFSSTGGSHGTIGNLEASNSTIYSGLTNFLSNDDPPPTGFPKAYLNWIFLDDQFNYVSSLSGSVQAASTTYPSATLNTVAPGSQLSLTKSGYLYIWVSNETQGWDVFFDNLSIQYKQGPVLEMNNYYPFGLTMQGLSDKAIKTNYAENKYRYNQATELQNKEFSDGTGLEMYETNYRGLDPQLGRFSQIDPMADETHFFSTYQYAINNPVLFCDPSGLLQQNPQTQKTMAYFMYLMNQAGGGPGSDVEESMDELQNYLNGLQDQDGNILTPEQQFNYQYTKMTASITPNAFQSLLASPAGDPGYMGYYKSTDKSGNSVIRIQTGTAYSDATDLTLGTVKISVQTIILNGNNGNGGGGALENAGLR